MIRIDGAGWELFNFDTEFEARAEAAPSRRLQMCRNKSISEPHRDVLLSEIVSSGLTR
jgi:hypothetical protein